MDAGSGPRICAGPAGFALVVAGLALLGATLVAPEAAVVLFMAVPALVAVTILRRARRRMKRPK